MKTTINYKATAFALIILTVLFLNACGSNNAAKAPLEYPATGQQVDLSANSTTPKPLKEYLSRQNKLDHDYVFQYNKVDNTINLIPIDGKATEIEEYLDGQLSAEDWADYMIDVTQISLAVGAISPNTDVNVVDPNDPSSNLYSVHNGVVSFSIAKNNV